MRGRIWILFFIPFIALIIWQVIVLLDSETTKAQWEVSAEGAEFSQCADAVSIDSFDTDIDTTLEAASISPLDAYNTAREVLSDSPRFNYGELVEITLPDDERKVVWAYVFVMNDGGTGLQGPTNVVYVDANTGEPLVLVTDAIMNDPYLAGCQLLLTSGVDDFFDKWQPGIYLVVYALSMLGAYGFVRLLDWFRARRAARSEA